MLLRVVAAVVGGVVAVVVHAVVPFLSLASNSVVLHSMSPVHISFSPSRSRSRFSLYLSIYLPCTTQPTTQITLDTQDPAEKLAYSCSLAQSAKLFVFEERLDNIIETTARYPQVLAATGKIPLTEVQIG